MMKQSAEDAEWRSIRQLTSNPIRRAQRETLTVQAAPPQPLEIMHWSMHSDAATFCEARANVVTGEPRVSRFVGSFDCGRILHPKTAASQFCGGIIIGLGLALIEETQSTSAAVAS